MAIEEAILYIGFSQSIFAALVLGTRQKVSIADRVLVACLLTIAFRFLITILGEDNLGVLKADFSVAIIPMTFGPFMYLYTTYLINGDSKFNSKDLLHFLPPVAFIILYLGFFSQFISFDETSYFEKDRFLAIRIIFGLTFFSSVLVYTIFTFVRLGEYRKKLKPKMSYNNGGIQLIWLNFVALLFSLLFLTYLIVGLINALTFSETLDLGLVSRVGLTVLAYATSYFGLRQPSILGSLYERAIKYGETVDNDGQSNQKSKISNIRIEEITRKLESCMEEKKPFLRPELTLADLAELMEVNKSELTYVLNNHIGKNFFSYVNDYRLKAVLEKLKDPACDHLTIISIAFDCGFNSKSTFNGLFKQHTGLTPTAYKQKVVLEGSN
ncbi:MAG: helix-turn-helix transcriptional regulator [Bacteroidota bacterium]